MSQDHSPGRATIGPDFDSVLTAAQTGAPWALERLYQALSPAVLGYLRIQGAADPEDLTNEVFLGVLRRIGSFEGNEEKFRSWVFTIAHSRLIDDRRRTDRRPHLAEPREDHWDRAGGDAEQEALERLSSQRVQALCERLVADQRDVLLLRLMAGLTIEVIAEALGSPKGQSKRYSAEAWPTSARFSNETPYPYDSLRR